MDLQVQKPYHMAKSGKYETFCVCKLPSWLQNWVTVYLLVRFVVSLGKTSVVLFGKCCCQIKQELSSELLEEAEG